MNKNFILKVTVHILENIDESMHTSSTGNQCTGHLLSFIFTLITHLQGINCYSSVTMAS